MWSLLAKMTIWKCHRKREYYLAQSRDVRTEKPLEGKEFAPSSSIVVDEKLILEESLDLVISRLEDENKKKAFLLTLQGFPRLKLQRN